MLKTAYQILEVSEEATNEEVENSFLRKSELHHPDHGGELESFLTLQQAKNVLLNPEMREDLGKRKLFRALPLRITPAFEEEIAQLIENLQKLGLSYNERGRWELRDQASKGFLLRRVA